MEKLEDLFPGLRLEIRRRKGQKKLYVRIGREGEICVSAPSHLSLAKIQSFLLEKRDRILMLRAEVLARRPATPSFQEGELYALWGQRYPLLRMKTEGERARFEKRGEQLCLFASPDAPLETLQETLTIFYRREMENALETVIPRMEEQCGLRAKEYRIRLMKSRWGSCNLQKKRIWLSLSLVHYDPRCLDLVLAHELVHLLEAHHNARFYRLLRERYPQMDKVKALLGGPQA